MISKKPPSGGSFLSRASSAKSGVSKVGKGVPKPGISFNKSNNSRMVGKSSMISSILGLNGLKEKKDTKKRRNTNAQRLQPESQ